MRDSDKIEKIQRVLKDFKIELGLLQARHRKEMEALLKKFTDKKIEEIKTKLHS